MQVGEVWGSIERAERGLDGATEYVGIHGFLGICTCRRLKSIPLLRQMSQ